MDSISLILFDVELSLKLSAVEAVVYTFLVDLNARKQNRGLTFTLLKYLLQGAWD